MVTVVVMGLLIWVLVSYRSILRFRVAYEGRNAQRDNVEWIKEQVGELEAQKQSLELGMFEIEKSVRESYRLVRPGEKMILIAEEEKTSAAAGPTNDRKSH